MKTVLVPLDGTQLSASVLPEAKRLAGFGGRIVLIRDVTHPLFDFNITSDNEQMEMGKAQRYLDGIAGDIRAEGFDVEVETMAIRDTAVAIDEAVSLFHVDAVACATHGRGPFGRLVRGGVAWRVMTNSHVPVLMKREGPRPAVNEPRHIMVPLDGSQYAEKALGFAEELANEWGVDLWLVQVITPIAAAGSLYSPVYAPYDSGEVLAEDRVEAQRYLDAIIARLSCRAHSTILGGSVTDALVNFVDTSDMTQVVMASHGRTGLRRVILGSVADELVQRLCVPIVIVPSMVLATGIGRVEEVAVEKVPARVG